MGSKKQVLVYLTHHQIALLDEAVRSHPDLASRGSYLEAVMEGKATVISYVPELRGTSRKSFYFNVSKEISQKLREQAKALGCPVSAPARHLLFGVEVEKPKEKRVNVLVYLTHHQIALLDEAVRSHPDLTSRGSYLEAVLEGEANAIPYVPELRGTSRKSFYFNVSKEVSQKLREQAKGLGCPITALVRHLLFGVEVEKPKEKRVNVLVYLTHHQIALLNASVHSNPDLTSRGSYLEAVMEGKATAITYVPEPRETITKLIVLNVSEGANHQLREQARALGCPITALVRHLLFGVDAKNISPYQSREKAVAYPFMDLMLRSYENEAVRASILRDPQIDSFGALVSALRKDKNIDVMQPVPTSTWKRVNTRIYLKADELRSLREDIAASGSTVTKYMLELLFGRDYTRTKS